MSPNAQRPQERSIERLRRLVTCFAASDLTRLELREGEFVVELLRRGPRQAPTTAPPHSTAEPAPSHLIQAELVGVVRMAKSPITEGTLLDRDRELASIESLGVKTPIRSGGAGRVTRVLVNDGDAVDYGQALFVVEGV
jgi:acetyl-CoA carboxylase biotin carboxyl carrier protein